MSLLIRDPPPEYEPCEETNLVTNSIIMNAGHDNKVMVHEIDPEFKRSGSEGKSRRSSSICIHLLFLTLSIIFIGCVLYYCLGVSARASSHRVHLYMKKEIQPPVVINIIQQKVILIKEIENQAQPGILMSFKNDSDRQEGHIHKDSWSFHHGRPFKPHKYGTTPGPNYGYWPWYTTPPQRRPFRPHRYGTTPRPYDGYWPWYTTPPQRRPFRPHRYGTNPRPRDWDSPLETSAHQRRPFRPHRYGTTPKEGDMDYDLRYEENRPEGYGNTRTTTQEYDVTWKQEDKADNVNTNPEKSIKYLEDKADNDDEENVDESTDYLGTYCLDVFTCFAYEIVEQPMTWHNAFRHCREKNGFLPGRDIYYELQLINKFPNFLEPIVDEGIWSSGKIVHGHYQFLDRAPGFAYAIFGPTVKGLECSKFHLDESSNTTTFTPENCRKGHRAVCLYPLGDFSDGSTKNIVPSLKVQNHGKDGVASDDLMPARIRPEKTRKAPFPVLHRQTTSKRPSVEVEESEMNDVELTCNNVPEDRVIWVKDGIFFKNGVATTNLFRTPNTLSGAYSRQGTYWCEMWKENSTERIASEKIYIHSKNLATVSLILKKNDYDLRDIECGLNASPFGCGLENDDCWYWDTVCSLQNYFYGSLWYPVDETLTFAKGIMSRATIQFFVPKDALDRVNWSEIQLDKNSTTSIIHAIVYEPYKKYNHNPRIMY